METTGTTPAPEPTLEDLFALIAARGWTGDVSGPFPHDSWFAYVTGWTGQGDARKWAWQTVHAATPFRTAVAALQSAYIQALRFGEAAS